MSMQRLAGSEDVLPSPDVSQLFGSSSSKEIENSVQGSLLKMEVNDYNPFLHERGFHQKLNLLVKESLQFGSITSSCKVETSEPNSTKRDSSAEAMPSKPTIDVVIIDKETPEMDLTVQEDQTTASIAAEWEQLIVSEIPKIYSPTCVSKPKLDRPVLSQVDTNRQLDERTSRILERLEIPKQQKTKVVSPIIVSGVNVDACVSRKTPLIPFPSTQAADQNTTGSQPMKPNFQRLKRKQR